jgi:hypothetical protein
MVPCVNQAFATTDAAFAADPAVDALRKLMQKITTTFGNVDKSIAFVGTIPQLDIARGAFFDAAVADGVARPACGNGTGSQKYYIYNP